MALTFKIAQMEHAEAVVELVNKAHRPAGGKGGWTNESHLVAGTRVEIYHILHLINHDNSVVIIGVDEHDQLMATLYITNDGTKAHIGMLSVDPDQQNKGYGSALLSYAETFVVKEFGVHQVMMLIVSDRPELLSFFERRNYFFTQQTMPFPIDAGVGIPKSDSLELLLLAKTFPTDMLKAY